MCNTKKLLLNHELSPEKFDKLLEYLYWEKEQEFALQKESLAIERLKVEKNYHSPNKSGKARTIQSNSAAATAAELDDEEDELANKLMPQRLSSYTSEDLEYNAATSYGLLGDSFVGKLAKTKLWSASKSRAESLFNQHKAILKEQFKSLDRLPKVKTLLHYILWGSAVAHRADRWPHAKDVEYLVPAKDDIDLKLVTYTDEQIAQAVNFLQERWGAICSMPDLSINTTLIAKRLDNAHEKLVLKEKHQEEYDVLKSPFIAKMLEKYNYISNDILRDRIHSNSFDYKNCFTFQVMRDFKVKPPPHITPSEAYPWLQQVPSYLTPYKRELEADAERVWNELREEQMAWDAKRRESL
jgi:hypothetical protein